MAKKSAAQRKAARPQTPVVTPMNVVDERAELQDFSRPTEAEREKFWQIAPLILIVAIAIRQLWLANFPYHPDEAIHAWFADGFANYRFDPVYHGPVLYHITALVFSFFSGVFKWLHLDLPGANDYTARLVPSLLGIGLVAMILYGPLRRWMGWRGVLWSAALVTISPVIATYARRILHDPLVLVLTLGAIIYFHRAREERVWTAGGRSAWLGVVLLLTGFLATKANAFFIIAMLLAFWAATWAQRWLNNRAPGGRFGALAMAQRACSGPVGAWLPLMLFVAVSLASIWALRDPPEVKKFNEQLLSLISLLCCGLLWAWIVLAPEHATIVGPAASTWDEENDEKPAPVAEVASQNENPRARRTATWRTALMAAWGSVLVFAFFFGHGFLWWKVPVDFATQNAMWRVRAASSFQQILAATHGQAELTPGAPDKGWTDSRLTIADDWDDVTMAMPRLIAYWKNQQQNPRLPGRHDYYLVLITLYELPIFIAALCGVVYLGRHRSAWGDLLLWWAFTSWVLYAVANEKVPWLLQHMVLPFALIGGWWLSQLRLETVAKRQVFYAACALSAIFLLRNISATNFEAAVAHREPMFYAQTSEAFRDALFNDLQHTRGDTRTIWAHSDKQWPTAWYLRGSSPLLNGSGAAYGGEPDVNNARLIITTPDDWNTRSQRPEWKKWQATTVEHYIWPRASWPALNPARYLSWWWNRQALTPAEQKLSALQWQQSILQPPGEWSDSTAVFAMPK